MKKMYTLLVLGLLASGSSMAQTQGGPDQYGYTWKDNAATGGPTYNWIDITSSGVPITGLADDNTIGPFNFGFTFRYYWTDVTRAWVGSNGYVVLNGNGQISSIASGFPTMPTASNPNNVVVPRPIAPLPSSTSRRAAVGTPATMPCLTRWWLV